MQYQGSMEAAAAETAAAKCEQEGKGNAHKVQQKRKQCAAAEIAAMQREKKEKTAIARSSCRLQLTCRNCFLEMLRKVSLASAGSEEF